MLNRVENDDALFDGFVQIKHRGSAQQPFGLSQNQEPLLSEGGTKGSDGAL